MALKRDKRLHMLMADEEWAWLQALADKDGLSASDVVRQLVRRAHAEAFCEQKAPKPAARRASKGRR